MEIQRSFYDARHDHGFWSPSTSAANFCEEDYAVSYVIAEFVNTLSNFAYLYYVLYPPSVRLESNTHVGNASLRDRIRSLDVQGVSLILVGLSSGVFHASMHALPQWLDESSMYLLAASWIYILLTTSYNRHDAACSSHAHRTQPFCIRRTNRRTVAVCLVTALALSSLTSYLTGNLDVHSIVFALLLILSGLKLIYFILAWTQYRGSVPVLRQPRKVLLGKLAKAIIFLVLGFGLWLVDSNPAACHYLRGVRQAILSKSPLLRPLTFLFELHGWWHVLTARAAGEYISLVRYLTAENREQGVKKHA